MAQIKTLRVGGMTCVHCAAKVTTAVDGRSVVAPEDLDAAAHATADAVRAVGEWEPCIASPAVVHFTLLRS